MVNATYIHIPKTGGTSFDHWVMDNVPNYQDAAPLGHCDTDRLRQHWPDLGYVFTFVRNPYDRLVSQFFYMLQDAELRIARRRSPSAFTPKWIFEDRFIVDDIRILKLCAKGFDHWIECMYNSSPELTCIWRHDTTTRGNVTTTPRTQLSYFCGTMPDLVIKSENLDTEFYRIQELLTQGECRDQLGRLNTSDHAHYSLHYTERSKHLATLMFQEDLDAFNYTF